MQGYVAAMHTKEGRGKESLPLTLRASQLTTTNTFSIYISTPRLGGKKA